MRSGLFRSVITAVLAAALLLSAARTDAVADSMAVASHRKSILHISIYDSKQRTIASGKGFVLGSGGIVATSSWLISQWSEGETRISFRTGDGKDLGLESVIATDRVRGISLLKVAAKGLDPVKLAAGYKPRKGDPYYVISSSPGRPTLVLGGIIKNILPKDGSFEVPQASSAEHEGAPVFNAKGEVIGLVSHFTRPVKGPKLVVSVKQLSELVEAFKRQLLARAYFELGLAYEAETGRSEEAISAYQEAARMSAGNAGAYYNLGLVSGRAGRQQEAVEAFREVVRLEPGNAEAYNNLGVAYSNLGRQEEALAAFTQAVKLSPDNVDAYNNLGVAYGKMARFPEAIGALKQVVRIRPDHAEAHFNLGVAHSKAGQLPEALEAFTRVLNIRPDDAEALNRLGIVYGRLGRFEEAAAASSRALGLKPEFSEAYTNIGAAYGSMGKNQEALDAFKQAIRIRPDNSDARYLLAVLYIGMGDTASALNEYNTLKKLDKTLAQKLSKHLNE
ncbi:MAG: serine protease [Nitrospirae bacterium]|nr:MAG: serine protease [Nitrospirota bacterium]